MRFKFDRKKSEQLKRNPKRGIGFIEVQQIWNSPYYLDQRSEEPEQYRAIGWVGQRLFSVIFEVRSDKDGEYYKKASTKARGYPLTSGDKKNDNAGASRTSYESPVVGVGKISIFFI